MGTEILADEDRLQGFATVNGSRRIGEGAGHIAIGERDVVAATDRGHFVESTAFEEFFGGDFAIDVALDIINA